jgi:hypothetical protein
MSGAARRASSREDWKQKRGAGVFSMGPLRGGMRLFLIIVGAFAAIVCIEKPAEASSALSALNETLPAALVCRETDAFYPETKLIVPVIIHSHGD